MTTALGLGLAAAPLVLSPPALAQESGPRSDLAIESDVLRQLATTQALAGAQISASTNNGIVTLRGSVPDDATRELAATTAAQVSGVRSVDNKLAVRGSKPAAPQTGQGSRDTAVQTEAEIAEAEGQNADGQNGATATPATQPSTPASGANPSPQQNAPAYPENSQPTPGTQGNWGPAGPPPDAPNGTIPQPPSDAQAGAQAGEAPAQQPSQQYPQSGAYPPAGQYPAPSVQGGQYPPQAQPYPPQAQPYPRTYPQSGGQYPQQYPRSYPQQSGQYPAQPPAGQSPYASNDGANGYGQLPPSPPAAPVTIPAGVLLTVRTNEPLDSRRVQPGDAFDATAARDVFENGVLAIPRGATIVGRVVDVKQAGALKGSAGFALQLTSLNMGGRAYPIATDTFATDTAGKGEYTAANTAGGAVLGALLGAIVGRGPGAAVGAVMGGAAGMGASAATAGPREVMRPETLLTFHLQAPVTVIPVSYQEAQRLAAASNPQAPRVHPRPYYGYAPPPPPPPYYPYPYPYRYWR